MRRYNRILSVFLMFSLVLCMVFSAAAAGNAAAVTVTQGEVSAGGEVTLTVSISDNPGVAAYLLYIYYDTSVFEVDPSSDLSAAGAFGSSGGLIGNSIEIAKANGRYDGDASKDGVLALWFNGSGTNTSADGSMLTITLQAKPGAASGSYTVELGYSPNDTCNQDGEDVRFQTASTTVKVTGGGASTPTPNPDPTPTPTPTPDPEPDEDITPDESPDVTPDVTPGGTVPVRPDAGKTETDEPEEEATETPAPSFTDTTGHWAESFIKRAAAMELVEGYNGQYRPNDTMTRAEFVTILWRASGRPQAKQPSTFTDLTQDWYRDAVAWAQENSVILGDGTGKFDPNGSITREQLVTILHRQAGTPVGMDMMLTGLYDKSFSDSDQISDWAKTALYWSVYNIIYCGENTVDVVGTLSPKAPANRAQIAVMIVRYLELE